MISAGIPAGALQVFNVLFKKLRGEPLGNSSYCQDDPSHTWNIHTSLPRSGVCHAAEHSQQVQCCSEGTEGNRRETAVTVKMMLVH